MQAVMVVLALVAPVSRDRLPARAAARPAGGDGGAVPPGRRWGAAAFFAGCALTHVMIAVAPLRSAPGDALVVGHAGHGAPAPGGLLSPFWEHVVPHVAQGVGGALSIGVAHRRLTLTVMT